MIAEGHIFTHVVDGLARLVIVMRGFKGVLILHKHKSKSKLVKYVSIHLTALGLMIKQLLSVSSKPFARS